MPKKKEVNWQELFELEINRCAVIKGFKKADIPAVLGISYPTYRRWMTNPGAISLGEFKRILKTFGIPTESVVMILERKM